MKTTDNAESQLSNGAVADKEIVQSDNHKKTVDATSPSKPQHPSADPRPVSE